MAFVHDKTVGFTVKGAEAAALPVRVAAGPFEVSRPLDGQPMTMADALLTGLLVIYPVLAIVAAVIVGLVFIAPIA
jgi:hypothetical protein